MSKRSSDETGSRRRNRSATQDALVAAARDEFSAKGYAAATTRAIAARVGCSEALIQNYFGGKEGLLAAVLGSNGESVRAAAAAFIARPPAETLADEVWDTLVFMTDLLRRSAQQVRILVERALGERAFGLRFASMTPRKVLCDGLAQRLARDWPDVGTPMIAAELVVSMGFELGFVHTELLLRDGAEIDEQLPRMATMITKAIDPP